MPRGPRTPSELASAIASTAFSIAPDSVASIYPKYASEPQMPIPLDDIRRRVDMRQCCRRASTVRVASCFLRRHTRTHEQDLRNRHHGIVRHRLADLPRSRITEQRRFRVLLRWRRVHSQHRCNRRRRIDHHIAIMRQENTVWPSSPVGFVLSGPNAIRTR